MDRSYRFRTGMGGLIWPDFCFALIVRRLAPNQQRQPNHHQPHRRHLAPGRRFRIRDAVEHVVRDFAGSCTATVSFVRPLWSMYAVITHLPFVRIFHCPFVSRYYRYGLPFSCFLPLRYYAPHRLPSDVLKGRSVNMLTTTRHVTSRQRKRAEPQFDPSSVKQRSDA